MSSPTPIITPKPPPPPPPPGNGGSIPQGSKVTIAPQGLVPAKTVIKHYTTWVFADESMPTQLAWGIRALAGVGLIAKFIKQQRPA
jgi:hypothetical protein